MFLPEVPAHQGCVFVKIEQDPREPWRGSQTTWQMITWFSTAGRKHSMPHKAALPWEPSTCTQSPPKPNWDLPQGWLFANEWLSPRDSIRDLLMSTPFHTSCCSHSMRYPKGRAVSALLSTFLPAVHSQFSIIKLALLLFLANFDNT